MALMDSKDNARLRTITEAKARAKDFLSALDKARTAAGRLRFINGDLEKNGGRSKEIDDGVSRFTSQLDSFAMPIERFLNGRELK